MAYLTGENRTVPSRELEEKINFPQQCIFNVGRRLKKDRLVNTVAGPFGGYALAKKPEDVTIQNILEVFKDEFYITDELSEEKAAATTLKNFASFLNSTKSEMDEKMSTFTLADLLPGRNKYNAYFSRT